MATAQRLFRNDSPGVSENLSKSDGNSGLETPTPLDLLRIAVMQTRTSTNCPPDGCRRLGSARSPQGLRGSHERLQVEPAGDPQERHVDQGEGKPSYDHATLDKRLPRSDPGARQARPSHTLDNEAAEGKPWIEVTCVLTHNWAQEETTLGAVRPTKLAEKTRFKPSRRP